MSAGAVSLWFEYATALAGFIYSTKLEMYESACQAALATATSTVAYEALFAQSCLTRPPRVMKRPEECEDDIELEKELVYRTLEDGYTVTAADTAAMRASQQARAQKQQQQQHSLQQQGKAAQSAKSECGSVVAVATAANDDDGDAGAEDTSGDLLYGELTSRGVRQLHALSCDLVRGAHAPPSSESETAVMVAVDIGCGTGKLLFEWARLAAWEYRRASPKRTEKETAAATEGTTTTTTTAPNTDSSNGSSDDNNPSRGSSRSRAEAAAGALVGWVGVGAELAPSRLAVAAAALAPDFLPLVPEPSPRCGEDSGNSAAAAAARQDGAEGGERRYVAIAHPITGPVRPPGVPAACVLLCGGDALGDGLLSNSTLFQFPRNGDGTASLGDDAAAGGAYDSLYRLCRGVPSQQRGVVKYRGGAAGGKKTNKRSVGGGGAGGDAAQLLAGIAAPAAHLVLFCSGLGFDADFVRLLCQRVEALLPGSSGSDASGSATAAAADGGEAAARRAGDAQWRSVTCVFLLRGALPLLATKEGEESFPLFRCCQEVPAPATGGSRSCGTRQQTIPEWCVGRGGLRHSSATVTHLDATWMSAAPAWVLHFRYD